MFFQQPANSIFPASVRADDFYKGLAPFLRASIAGEEMRPLAQSWLDQSKDQLDNPVWMMNLALALQSLSHKELGLACLDQALQQSRVFIIEPDAEPELTVLSLMFPGDIAANTPLECLLENDNIRIIQYFLCPNELFVESIPDHDLCYVAFSESKQLQPAIDRLTEVLSKWPKPVVNKPQYIQNTERSTAGRLLRDAPELVASEADEFTAKQLGEFLNLQQVTPASLGASQPANINFPIIIRPAGSHAGVGLEKVDSADQLRDYLSRNQCESYSLASFIDYSNADGYFRKYRIALIDGMPHACHMGISKHWMIHYVNAGMYEEAWKRSQEELFFKQFEQFSNRHAVALRELYHRIGLDYFCIDCAETKSGELLVFELDHCMVVHDMDLPSLFPYKPQQMAIVRDALIEYLRYRHRQSTSKRISRQSSKLANASNFSGGPGVMPESVLRKLSEAVLCEPELGISLLGVSHRSDWFKNLVGQLEVNIRGLLSLDESYRVLFLQGGATQQFTMVPMLLLQGETQSADYLHTGYWSGKSIEEARRIGPVKVIWSGQKRGFKHLPSSRELRLNKDAAYLHYVSNETVEGLQFHELIGRDDVLRVCDMSSDFLSRPIRADQFSIIYAHAQKNLGPAGVTVVVIKDELLDRVNDRVPSCLNYQLQAEANSIYNTPPVMAIYCVHLVVRWLIDEIGGLCAMDQINRTKAELLYQAIEDGQGFFQPRAERQDRSLMNVTFDLPTAELQSAIMFQARQAGISGLEGHRSIGGVRASLYNAMSIPSVEALTSFLDEFLANSIRRGQWRPKTSAARRAA
ncbi:MAG: 3-phosphoserine/phosphohydroxythreonine transaminase [Pirellulales bacterium]